MALAITNLRFLDQLRARQGARRRSVDAEDQGHRDPAGADRTDDAGGRPAGAALRAGDATTPTSTTFTAALAPRYCNFRKTTIYAGSNEIQRNIIAKMTLGL